MEVIIRSSAEEVAVLAGELLLEAVKANPSIVLGLATGRTMEAVYSFLASNAKKRKISFASVTTFNLDEYIGIPANHPQSYRTFMREKLFDKLDCRAENSFLPDGCAQDLDAECLKYEQLICAKGGIDLQLLGLGQVGHVGFNEPLSSLASRTRTKSLSPETRNQNSAFFGGADKVPSRAITMGVGTILESKRCLMLVTGKGKAEILARAVEGPITSVVSATALQLHPRCTVLVDEEAASMLQYKDYYRWVFQNEPEWQSYRG